MNYRLLKKLGSSEGRPVTARSHIVSVLTEEILNNKEPKAFPLQSEYQLCQRFAVSRVTVRLALTDLENRGLIYRKHGIGTFAHPRSTRIHRHIGVLLKSSRPTENCILAEILRGVQSVMSPLRSALILIPMPPEEWRPDLLISA